MNNKEEAAHAWGKESDKRLHYSNSSSAYLEGISDFKAALIQAVEKDRNEYISKRDGWKEGSHSYSAYDLAVRIHDKFLMRINETKPL